LSERRLANRLKELRGLRGLTQSQLAFQASVSRKTINTVENGVFVPSTLLALTLARCLEARVEDLFYIDDA
jgi:putative transcriptional regulator